MAFDPKSIAWFQARSPRERRLHLEEFLEKNPGDPAWITQPGLRELESVEAGGEGLLGGIPVAVKDNIDVAELPTTCACPDFAYTPETDAATVALLRAQGAIPVGKTNLDQFATGLVGTRSPYGTVPNTVDPRYISGGSSSGSASLVARGAVPLALGTDTAGSGRVPAGLNGIVGLKPTRGWFSTRGVVPACRTLDCVSVFATCVQDAGLAARILGQPDPADPYSRTRPQDPRPHRPGRLGYPANSPWFGDKESESAFAAALARWRWMGYELVPLDPTPFFQMASLLYQGPWVAERTAALGDFLLNHPQSIHPVVRSILEKGQGWSAPEAFQAEYRRKDLERQIHRLLGGLDALVVPTVPTTYMVEEVLESPLELNSRLGTWTNFVNLADLCALSLPAGTGQAGLPFGITLLGLPWTDETLLTLGREWERSGPTLSLAVVGAHMEGLPLNRQLTDRGGRFAYRSRTAPLYRFYLLGDTPPLRPGLVRVGEAGVSVELEVWDLPSAALGEILREIPEPLGLGTLVLENGTSVKGFLCEAYAVQGKRDISSWGGWRPWLKSLEPVEHR